MTERTPKSSVGSKDNKAFMILSALGILFVVDVHIGNGLSFLTHIFPYDSFFMPMFAFISGYFFRERNIDTWNTLLHFTVNKIRRLLLPYLGWILFYIFFTAALRLAGVWEIGQFTPLDLLHNIATAGTSLGFNDPAWYVPLLFCVIITYCFIRKMLGRFWNDWGAMVVFALAAACAVCLARTDFNTNNTYMLMKVPFFLQFYHLGVLFRSRLEFWFDRANGTVLCVGAMAVNTVLIAVYGVSNIEFPMCASMSGFFTNNPFLPLITSVTGIAFWLKIAKGLVPVLGQNPLVNFISDNTAFIMTHHVAVKHLFLWLLLLVQKFSLEDITFVDVQQFRTDVWYTVVEPSWCKVACFLFTTTMLILLCRGFERLKQVFHRMLPRK